MNFTKKFLITMIGSDDAYRRRTNQFLGIAFGAHSNLHPDAPEYFRGFCHRLHDNKRYSFWNVRVTELPDDFDAEGLDA